MSLLCTARAIVAKYQKVAWIPAPWSGTAAAKWKCTALLRTAPLAAAAKWKCTALLRTAPLAAVWNGNALHSSVRRGIDHHISKLNSVLLRKVLLGMVQMSGEFKSLLSLTAYSCTYAVWEELPFFGLLRFENFLLREHFCLVLEIKLWVTNFVTSSHISGKSRKTL